METQFTLEPWRPDHAPALAKYADNPKIGQFLLDGFPHPYTLEDARAFIRACTETEGRRAINRAIVVDNQAVGSIGITFGENVYRKGAMLGYWLGEPFWGRGIMALAVRQLTDHIFSAYDIVRIYAEPFSSNPRSSRVLEKAGFTLEGVRRLAVVKDGEMMDSHLYALIREG